MAIRTLTLVLLCNLVYYVSAQGGLPDSISNVDCLSLQSTAPHVCCEPDTGNFCQIQCNNGLCRCVDPLTGLPIGDFTFLENDESVDCLLIIPDAPETTIPPEPTTTDDEEETSRSDSDSTNSTRSSDSTDGSGDTTDSSSSNSTRSDNTDGSGDTTDSSRTDSSRSNETRSDRTDSSRGRSDSTGRSDRDRSDTNNTRSDSTSRVRCPRVSQLLASDECVLSCIVEDENSCPACNDTCFDLVPSGPLASETPCNCTINQVCLRVGRFGEFRCVDLLSEGERCDSERYNNDDDDKDDENGSGDMDRSDKDKKSRTTRDADETSDSSALGRVGGARDRRNFGDLGGATVGCEEGLICTPVSIGRSECLPENPDGACVIARQQGLDAQCSPDGAFQPLQVHTDEDDLYHVVCVQPSDGSPISGTEIIVADMDNAPDCDRLVGCSVERGGQSFDVPHGDFFIYVNDDDDDKSESDDNDECQRCLCSNGEATLCEPANCTALQPLSCSYQGQSYNHGDTFDVDCNRCGCRNGQIRCTRAQCDDSQIRDRCQECMSEPLDQVCGINGVTYDSPCVAVYCAGLAPFDFFRGACLDVDVCALYPCQDGETCVHKGGATCFDSNGCDPDDLRLCVDPNSLVCDDDDGDDDDDDEVCATNGVTYPSVCRLLQDTGNEAVAYAGECEREECQGGKVCGTDGETYDNVCVLRAQSANARVDYNGECDDDLEDIIEEICERVSSSGRCSYNLSNCRFLVDPEEGCCALCGGIVFIAMDLAGLSEYVRLNPSIRTLDDFIELLVDSDFVSDEITEKCELEASLTVSGNIQIVLSARSDDDDDGKFCNAASEFIAATINDLSLVPQSAHVPEVLQFASAALAAPINTATTNVVDVVSEVVDNVNQGVNGTPVLKALSYLTLLLLIALSFVFF